MAKIHKVEEGSVMELKINILFPRLFSGKKSILRLPGKGNAKL